MDYYRPAQVDEALAILKRYNPRVLAGGTDVFPALQNRPLSGPVLDLSGLKSLRYIKKAEGFWEFGAGATWSDVLAADLSSAFDALKQAAREVGSVQIQNRATLAGNICNASPAADGVPPLLTLDAEVILKSRDQTRIVPLERFILGNRRTVLISGEIVTAIRIPERSAGGTSVFLKLGARRYLVISIAMVAVRLATDSARAIAQCSVAVGACSPVAKRLLRLEQTLAGLPAGELARGKFSVSDEVFDGLSPIDDVRAPAHYRSQSVKELVKRAIAEAAQGLAR